LQDSIALASGIGPKRAAALHKRNIDTFVDALVHLPYRYIDLRQRQDIADLRPEMDAVVAGRLEGLNLRPRRYGNFHSASSAKLVDAAKRSIKVVWFNLPSYTQFPVGEPVLLCGRVTVGKDGTLQFSHPEVHRLAGGELPPIRPVYSLPKEVPQRSFFSAVSEILAKLENGNAGTPMDAMPVEFIHTSGTLPVAEALRYLHRPPLEASIEQLESADTPAHQALALDEMFAFQLALCRDRARTRRRKGAAMTGPARLTDEFIASLPFVPTGAQVRAIDEIGNDLAGPAQMNRLLIGDVGSGKTMVAFWAALRAA
jgi:ATP-dependent DNA helicase RecG